MALGFWDTPYNIVCALQFARGYLKILFLRVSIDFVAVYV
jgi:hypothetical protein